MNDEQILIYTDGGSRGNPGPAASAFTVEVNDKVVFKGSKHLGIATNNFAEYSGVIIALEWILQNPEIVNSGNRIIFNLDSELVVRQLNGVYKVKDLALQKLFLEIRGLMNKTDKRFVFKNIPREKNKIADSLVNQELDRNIRS